MTNFFEHQAAARRKTGLLVVYFVAALIGLVVSTYLLVWALFLYGESWDVRAVPVWNPGLLVGVSAMVGMLVGGCSVYKVAQLSDGGSAVALLLGGRELSGDTRDPAERRLLNVVEEMAIASGLPVPPVYVLDEPGINAFAAGYAPGDAVVGVSRGALEYLTRDELQGVVAHEFSHILNGDMRLNIRLMGLVFGILGLALVGQFIMRASSNRGSSRSDSKGRGQLVLLGLGLYLLGLAGAFFGNLIKAAVSRQREYLADASAVQFTRLPDGIGGALKKIGGLDKGPNLDHPNAPEASHMFFADALSAKRLSELLATHPPLPDRIKRVLPEWDGTFPDVHPVGTREAERRKAPSRPPLAAGMPTLPGLPQVPFPILAEAAVDRAGTLTVDQADQAAELLAAIPDAVRAAAGEPFGARALVYGLLLDPKPDVRAGQIDRLKAELPAADAEALKRLAGPLGEVSDAARLPLIDLVLPALRKMSPAQYRAFRTQVDHLIRADQCVSPFEFVLGSVLERHLDAAFGIRTPTPKPDPDAGPGVVLSVLAWEGNRGEEAARRAYEAGMRHYHRGAGGPPMLLREACGLDRLGRTLRHLSKGSLGARRRLLLACAACIAADRQTTVREAELYRGIGDLLGCPIPPLAGPTSAPPTPGTRSPGRRSRSSSGPASPAGSSSVAN